MNNFKSILIIPLVVATINCDATETGIKSPEAIKLQDQYLTATNKADTDYIKELEALKLSYTKKGDLDTANLIRFLVETNKVVLLKQDQIIPLVVRNDQIEG